MKELTLEERMRRVIRVEQRILNVRERMAWTRAKRKAFCGICVYVPISLGIMMYPVYIQNISAISKLISVIIGLVSGILYNLYYNWNEERNCKSKIILGKTKTPVL